MYRYQAPRYLVVAAILPLAIAAESCKATDSTGRTYDLSGLTANSVDAEWIAKDTASNDTFRLNVCAAVVSETWNVPSPEKIGIYKEGSRGGESLGAFNTTLQPLPTGVSLVYTGGSLCPDGRSSKASIIHFSCSMESGLGHPEFVGSLNECAYFFQWTTILACSQSSSGFGRLLYLIIFLYAIPVSHLSHLLTAQGTRIAPLAVVLYIAIVILHKRFFQHKRGLDQLPSLPGGPMGESLTFLSDMVVITGATLYEKAKDLFGRLLGRRRAGGFVGLPQDAEETRGFFAQDEEEEGR